MPPLPVDHPLDPRRPASALSPITRGFLAAVSAALALLALSTTLTRPTPPTADQRVHSILLDPNRASADQLALLPGVGPVLSTRIIEERELGGHFDHPDDLARVIGIGPKTIERLTPHLRFDAPLPDE